MQGWASFYDFNFSDLRSGADVVIANSEGRQPHWKKLRGLLENAIYGGRVDNIHDFQVCLTSLSLIFAVPDQLLVCRQSSSVQLHNKAQDQLLHMSGCVSGPYR
jgi:hypothetical protein